MRHRVLACDYDGTLATEGICADSTIEALRRVAGAGIRMILVTGRTREELESVFDHSDLFEAIVIENGAVVIDVATDTERVLAPRVPAAMVEALDRAGVDPLVVGRVLVSTSWTQEEKLAPVIARLGLDRMVVRNRNSAMVLPPGISKRTGFDIALQDIGELPANTVAIGDGENDVAMFAAAGVSVAVANAVDILKARADVVLDEPNGRGVQTLVGALIAGDLGSLTARSPLAG